MSAFPHLVACVTLVYDVFYPRVVSFSVVASGGLFLCGVWIWVHAQKVVFSKMIK